MKEQRKFVIVKPGEEGNLAISEPGLYAVFFHNLSCDLRFEIRVPRVKLYIFGLYTGTGENKYTLSTTQLHSAPSSFSDLLVKGVFQDRSQFIYDGLIRIEKKGNGSHAYQKNQNLLLSENVFVSSKPDLEILANDVFCTHGSTTGRPNQKQEYYLQTRGLNKSKAEQVIISGFIQSLFHKIEQLGFSDEINSYKQSILNIYA